MGSDGKKQCGYCFRVTEVYIITDSRGRRSSPDLVWDYRALSLSLLMLFHYKKGCPA